MARKVKFKCSWKVQVSHFRDLFVMCGNRSARRKTTEEEVSFSFRHLCLFDIFSLGGNRSARGKTTLPDTG